MGSISTAMAVLRAALLAAADAEPQRPFPGRVLPPPLLLGPPRCLLDPEEQRQVKPFADRLASRLRLRRFAVVFLQNPLSCNSARASLHVAWFIYKKIKGIG